VGKKTKIQSTIEPAVSFTLFFTVLTTCIQHSEKWYRQRELLRLIVILAVIMRANFLIARENGVNIPFYKIT
jgi:hypothetical protein